MKNLYDYLPKEYSWWELVDEYSLKKLNETKPTEENIRIIFFCDNGGCQEYHVADFKDIKLHHDGDYDFCCPNMKQELGGFQAYLDAEYLPEELEVIFNVAPFAKNYEDD